MNVDLHVHTTVSDGRYTPQEIVRKATGLGLTVISISDHDSVDGIAEALEAAKDFSHLKVIPGVEISTDLKDGEAHVLGYFIDFTSGELKSALEHFRNSRETRAQKMIARLSEMGIHIDWQRVQEIAGDGSIGRPHIAQAMLEKGYIGAIKDAFSGYLEHGGPAYVEREKMTPAEAVRLILNSGGLPVLAHPYTVNKPEALLVELKEAGLIGIEAYYDSYTTEEIDNLLSLAGKYGLIATGGSDYHGLDDSNESMLGSVDVPMSCAQKLIDLADRRILKMSDLL